MDANNCQYSNKSDLLRAVESCGTIAEIFTLVKNNNIDMRMQTLNAASNIPPRLLEYDSCASLEDPLIRLKEVVTLAVMNQYR